jgi:selenide, water dikinase
VTVALTSLSHGAGCGCKLPAADVHALIGRLPVPEDPRVLVGSEGADDAGVFRLREDLALVQTVDFFTPIVDEPELFGRIAATNALSDVWAMGGEPLTALNLVAFPLDTLGGEVLEAILRGGGDVARAAGVAVLGGHSIDDPEPKYGMAVTGTVHPDRILTNAGGRPGDVLVLTKPLGAGAVVTAHKRGAAPPGALDAAVAAMCEPNREASHAARAAGAHAVTDVTGFGLLGHLHELARASGCAAEVDAAAVPALPGAAELLADETGVSGGGRRNAAYAGTFTSGPVPPLLCDPMTSGGLLVAVDPAAAATVPGPVVGRLIAGRPGAIAVGADPADAP